MLTQASLHSCLTSNTILESKLSNKLKQALFVDHLTDLQEIKLGDQQRIEALFERAVHLQLPPKKMKFLFKRYLQYEQEHGNAAAVAHVKKQALDFVQQHMAA